MLTRLVCHRFLCLWCCSSFGLSLPFLQFPIMDVVSFFTTRLLSSPMRVSQEKDTVDWSTLPMDVVINIVRRCGRREIQSCRLLNRNWCTASNFVVPSLHITPALVSSHGSLDTALRKLTKKFGNIRKVTVDAQPKMTFGIFARYLGEMESLDLSGMRIKDIGDFGNIKELKKLQQLNLGRSNMRGTMMLPLAQCTMLDTLDLWRTSVRYEDIRHVLPALSNLKTLNLGYTRLTDREMDFFGELQKLQILDLGNTSIGSRTLQSLSGLVRLKSLFLDYTKVDDDGTQYLSHLTNLVDLNMCNTNISDAGLSNFTSLTNLKDLKLGQTTISDDGLLHFSCLSNLVYIYLDGTNVRDAGVNYLTTIMPHLHVQIRLDTSGIQF